MPNRIEIKLPCLFLLLRPHGLTVRASDCDVDTAGHAFNFEGAAKNQQWKYGLQQVAGTGVFYPTYVYVGERSPDSKDVVDLQDFNPAMPPDPAHHSTFPWPFREISWNEHVVSSDQALEKASSAASWKDPDINFIPVNCGKSSPFEIAGLKNVMGHNTTRERVITKDILRLSSPIPTPPFNCHPVTFKSEPPKFQSRKL